MVAATGATAATGTAATATAADQLDRGRRAELRESLWNTYDINISHNKDRTKIKESGWARDGGGVVQP